MSEPTVTRLPDATPQPLREVVDALRQAPRHEPFAQVLLDTLAAISKAILAAPELSRRAEAVSLGFWLRPANLRQLAAAYASNQHPSALRVPAGVVFHVPPANVDTLFVFSWALSFACGNASLVRISQRRSQLVEDLLRIVTNELRARPALEKGNVFVTYGHDAEITAAISAAIDVRVVWGGNATVAALRAVPLSPHAKEVVFADRLSLSVLSSAAWLQLDGTRRAELARRVFGDIYSFDQLACSSARLLVFQGNRAATDAAAESFSSALRLEIERRGYHVEPATALAKYAAICRAAIDWPVARIGYDTLDWVVVDLATMPTEGLPNEATGGGLVLQLRIDTLDELVPWIDRRVQTITHHGFARSELEAFVRAVGGRGCDRLVPLGDALAFSSTWDGYDLLSEMTRLVEIRGGT